MQDVQSLPPSSILILATRTAMTRRVNQMPDSAQKDRQQASLPQAERCLLQHLQPVFLAWKESQSLCPDDEALRVWV